MSDVGICNNSLGVINTCSFCRRVFRFLSACSVFFEWDFTPKSHLCCWEKAIPAQLPSSQLFCCAVGFYHRVLDFPMRC